MMTLIRIGIVATVLTFLPGAPVLGDNLPSPCANGEVGAGANCLYLVAAGATYEPSTGERSVATVSTTLDIEVWMEFGTIAVQGGGFDITYDTSLVSSADWAWDQQFVDFDAITLSGAAGITGWEGIQFDDFAGNGFGGSTGTRPGFLRVGTLTLAFNQSAMVPVGIAQPYTDATFPNCFAPGAASGGSGCVATGFFGLSVDVMTDSDSDADGVADSVDNCTLVFNPAQIDTNGDGFGNFCDADFDGDCGVNFSDLQIIKGTFFSTDPDTDLNGDGSVNFGDLDLVRDSFFGQPGPSALASCP